MHVIYCPIGQDTKKLFCYLKQRYLEQFLFALELQDNEVLLYLNYV